MEVASLLLIGLLVRPGDERQAISGLDELLGCDFSRLSLNTLYKVSDTLLENKDAVESLFA